MFVLSQKYSCCFQVPPRANHSAQIYNDLYSSRFLTTVHTMLGFICATAAFNLIVIVSAVCSGGPSSLERPFDLVPISLSLLPRWLGWRIQLLDHASLHTHNHTLTYPLSLVLVDMMRSKEFKISRSILMLIL